MPKDFSKKIRPDFSNSPMYQEHDERIETVLEGQSESTSFEQPAQPIAPSAPKPVQQPQPVQQVQKPAPAVEQIVEEPYKNVSVRMPMHIYEQMNKLKYFSGYGKISIKDMVILATEAWVTEKLNEANK